MENLLDDNFENPKRLNDNQDKLSFVLSLIMLFGGIVFLKYTTNLGAKAELNQLIVASFVIQLICVSIGLILSLISNFFKREFRDKILSKSFLSKSVLKGFIIWLLITAIVIIDQILL